MTAHLSINNDEPSTPTEAIGVPNERVDPYTLGIIDYLFPGHHGIRFLSGILGQASVKQLALPEFNLPLADVAVIKMQSLRSLARLIGFSYDTTEKYIVVMSRLHLLYKPKKRQRRQIILYFPLGRCLMPQASDLDDLNYRPKVVTFARQIQRRLSWQADEKIKAFSPEDLTSSTRTSLMEASERTLLLIPQLLEDIRQILHKEVDSETESRLSFKIGGAIRYRCTQSGSRLSGKDDSFVSTFLQESRLFLKDDSEAWAEDQPSRHLEKDDLFGAASSQERRLSRKDDLFIESTRQESRLFDTKGDSDRRETEPESCLSPQKGGSFDPPSTQERRLFPKKGDSFLSKASQERRLLPEKGDSDELKTTKKATFAPQKGDFSTPELGATLNDNVITLSITTNNRDDSDNDAELQEDRYSSWEAGRVGHAIAMVLENSPANAGGFVVKCKRDTRTVVQAAMIDVLVRQAFPMVDPTDDHGRPNSRGACFHTACNKYAGGTPIPAFVRKWLKTDLSWRDLKGYWESLEEQLLQAELNYKRYMLDSRQADLVRQWLRGEIDQPTLDEALQTQGLSSVHQPSQEGRVPSSSALEAKSDSSEVERAMVSLSSASSSPVEEKTWMNEVEAQILAEEILRDAAKYGVTRAVPKPEYGVYVVMLTLDRISFPMKNPQQWRKYLASVEPELIKRMQQQKGA